MLRTVQIWLLVRRLDRKIKGIQKGFPDSDGTVYDGLLEKWSEEKTYSRSEAISLIGSAISKGYIRRNEHEWSDDGDEYDMIYLTEKGKDFAAFTCLVETLLKERKRFWQWLIIPLMSFIVGMLLGALGFK